MRILLTILALLAYQTAAGEASYHPSASHPQVALSNLTGTSGGAQVYSDWRKVRPPDKLKPDLDKLKPDTDKLKPDPDKVTVKVEATHHHRRHHRHHGHVVVRHHPVHQRHHTARHHRQRHHRRH